MAETFDSIRIVTQDGSHELAVTEVPRAQRLENFKSRVALELTRTERRYISPGDLELFVFGEGMEDKGTFSFGLSRGLKKMRKECWRSMVDGEARSYPGGLWSQRRECSLHADLTCLNVTQ